MLVLYLNMIYRIKVTAKFVQIKNYNNANMDVEVDVIFGMYIIFVC